MDIFRERELLERQEQDLEYNSRYDSLPIPKSKIVKRINTLSVGETVWLQEVGPRSISSVNMEPEGRHVHYITLAEEYGRFGIDQISKYKIIEHLEFVNSIKNLDWKFIYKYGLPLGFMPIELTIASLSMLICTSVILDENFTFAHGVIFISGLLSTGWFIYLTYSHISKFARRVIHLVLHKREKEKLQALYAERGIEVPPDDIPIRRIRHVNPNDQPEWQNMPEVIAGGAQIEHAVDAAVEFEHVVQEARFIHPNENEDEEEELWEEDGLQDLLEQLQEEDDE